jgi:hypothetical protein
MGETVLSTAARAQANLHAVLQLAATGRLRCSETTRRPAAATVAAVADVLGGGDFYPGEPIAAFAWPLLLQAGGLATTIHTRRTRRDATPPSRRVTLLLVLRARRDSNP